MPLSEHEQKILEDIERSLQKEDPRFAQQVTRHSLFSLLSNRIRVGVLVFIAGFVMLMLFVVSVWVAIGGFGLMLASALFVYHQLRRLGADQLRGAGGGAMSDLIGRLGRKLRRDPRDEQR